MRYVSLLLIVSFISSFVSLFLSQGIPNRHPVILLAGDRALPPFEYLDSDGNPKGFVVEIVRALSKEIGIPIKIQLTNWDRAVSLLERGEVDGLEFMRITGEREKLFDFVPIIENFSVIVVLKGSHIKNLSSLKGERVACTSEDVAYDLLKDLVDLVLKDTQEDVLKAVLNGEVPCGVVNYYFARWMITEKNWGDRLTILPDRLFTSYSGIALKKGSEYLPILMKGFTNLKEKGIYDTILLGWLGEEPIVRERLKGEETRNLILLIVAISVSIIVFILLLVRSYLRKEVDRQTLRVKWLLREERDRYNELSSIYDFLHKSTSIIDLDEKRDLLLATLRVILPNRELKIFRKVGDYYQLWASYPQEEPYSVTEDEIDTKLFIKEDGDIFGFLVVKPDIPENSKNAVEILLKEFENILRAERSRD